MPDDFNYGNAAVLFTGAYLPEEVVTNKEFDGKTLYKYKSNGERISGGGVVCTDDWIIKRTGIKERRRTLANKDSSFMALRAIENALEGNLGVDELNGIISATVTSPQGYPSVACEAQGDLGYKGNRKFVAHDVGAACAGFGVAVVNAVGRFAISSEPRYIAVSASEHLTRDVDYSDQNSPLFGDGAGAVIIGRAGSTDGLEGRIVGHFEGSTVEDGRLELIVRDENGNLRMPEGDKVYVLAVKNMLGAVAGLKSDLGWDNDDLGLVIPHQANLRIIETVAKKSGLGMDKVFVNIERYGNMSSATCAVGLHEAIHGVPKLGIEPKIQEGSKVIIVSFGSGLVTSAIALDYAK